MRHLIMITTLTVALAALLAPIAQADPARHMHDYLAAVGTERPSAIPHDIRDHAEIRQLIRSSVSAPATRSSFSWGDAGLGAGASAVVFLLAGGTAAVAFRRRRSLAL